MASPNSCDQGMALGENWNAEKMLNLYIYNYMKKRGLHDVADIFEKEARLEMISFLDSDEGLLKEWWECFWPQYSSSSTLANKAGGSSQSLAQPSMHALAMPASIQKQGATSSQDIPVGNSQRKVIRTPVSNQHVFARGDSSVVNAMGQQPVSLLRTTPVISQRKAGKLPVKTEVWCFDQHYFEK